MKLVRWFFKTIKWIVILFFTSTILAVVAFRFLPVPLTPFMVIRSIQQQKEGNGFAINHSWVPLNQISPHLPVAVMASEDQWFLKHHGFDTDAIKKAAEYNKTHKRKLGASTITQQTAKNVFLWPDRTWVRKGFETYFTVLIELFWSKQRIMEVYLNSIEMGDGIYGAEEVAQKHFNKTASSLTREECALIAASLPNPHKYNTKRPDKFLRKKQKHVLRQMKFMPSFPKEGETYDPNTTSGGIYHKK